MRKKVDDFQGAPANVTGLEVLARRILSGDFIPGQPLRETVLSQQLGLSRNAIREALNQLVGVSIVEYIPYCGYRMRDFTPRDLLEWYEFREGIEPIAARRLAVARPPEAIASLEQALKEMEDAIGSGDEAAIFQSDRSFHLALVGSCGNHIFSRLHNTLYLATLFVNNVKFSKVQEISLINAYTLAVHGEILRCIKAGLADASEAIVRDHIHRHVEKYTKLLGADSL